MEQKSKLTKKKIKELKKEALKKTKSNQDILK